MNFLDSQLYFPPLSLALDVFLSSDLPGNLVLALLSEIIERTTDSSGTCSDLEQVHAGGTLAFPLAPDKRLGARGRQLLQEVPHIHVIVVENILSIDQS